MPKAACFFLANKKQPLINVLSIKINKNIKTTKTIEKKCSLFDFLKTVNFFKKVTYKFSFHTNTKNTSIKGGKIFMANQTFRPGEEVNQDVTLYVKDAHGNTLGEIRVPAGHRVPPTRIKDAESYSTSK